MATPTKLGKYDIKGELGTGAMGVVYRAKDTRLGRTVALKVMSPNLARDPEFVKRFYREAQAAGQLHHPNIVTIHDIDEVDGIPFIAMELLDGDDLQKVISSRKAIKLKKKLDIIEQACNGLHHAHQRGIVHRDVKPGNIILLEDGMVKIVDFGIAHLNASSLTQTGAVLGTAQYLAPELINGQSVDARADIFSIGVTLYELLTFRSPFWGPHVASIFNKILNEPPDPLNDQSIHFGQRLENVLTHALEKDRAKRYQTAYNLALDLRRVVDSMQPESTSDSRRTDQKVTLYYTPSPLSETESPHPKTDRQRLPKDHPARAKKSTDLADWESLEKTQWGKAASVVLAFMRLGEEVNHPFRLYRQIDSNNAFAKLDPRVGAASDKQPLCLTLGKRGAVKLTALRGSPTEVMERWTGRLTPLPPGCNFGKGGKKRPAIRVEGISEEALEDVRFRGALSELLVECLRKSRPRRS